MNEKDRQHYELTKTDVQNTVSRRFRIDLFNVIEANIVVIGQTLCRMNVDFLSEVFNVIE